MRQVQWRLAVRMDKAHTIVIDQGDLVVAHHPISQKLSFLIFRHVYVSGCCGILEIVRWGWHTS